ncbi:MAG TPA: glycosyltransferase family 2 protein [Candidatus Saccharimonadales bacterium]
MKKSHSLSVIIPFYNESANVSMIYGMLREFIDDHIAEFVFVNDGSRDNSVDEVRKLQKKDDRVRLIDFSRNFGKEAALSAGLLECTGDAAIMLDCDGQHPPRLLPKFIEQWEHGAEIVIGRRTSNEKAGLVKTAGSALYHRLLNIIHASQPIEGDTDFRLIDRRVIEAFRDLKDHNRVTRSLINWLGFEKSYVDFEADPRTDGVAGYTFQKLFRLAIDGLTTTSMRPLLFSALIGAVIFGLGVLLGLFMVIEQFLLNDPLSLGFSGTAYLAIFILIMTSLMLIGQGIQGIYLANIYSEARNRPLYVAREITKPKTPAKK